MTKTLISTPILIFPLSLTEHPSKHSPLFRSLSHTHTRTLSHALSHTHRAHTLVQTTNTRVTFLIYQLAYVCAFHAFPALKSHRQRHVCTQLSMQVRGSEGCCRILPRPLYCKLQATFIPPNGVLLHHTKQANTNHFQTFDVLKSCSFPCPEKAFNGLSSSPLLKEEHYREFKSFTGKCEIMLTQGFSS